MQPKQTALILVLTVGFLSVTTPSKAQSLSDLDGNAFLANPSTGQFLGNVSSDRYDDESICNSYGTYGSRYEELSVLNNYGDYGSRYSNYSAYNPRAQYPPFLYLKNGQPLAVVSVNSNWERVIHPGALFGVICGQR
ncbi:hypothetical protein A6770_29070 [Nostoc minutum NIES-26]|uniref:Uncharacterized protein n=1 Tax=Nostoc minutum NIES-26 TaxID=1844469 RepID=A0A367QI51_9NOSO|nr:hypothetical protein A6770_29070 [Nostoc minutum NIES-26]